MFRNLISCAKPRHPGHVYICMHEQNNDRCIIGTTNATNGRYPIHPLTKKLYFMVYSRNVHKTKKHIVNYCINHFEMNGTSEFDIGNMEKGVLLNHLLNISVLK